MPPARPVAVVGGGIAGAAACIALASRGLPARWIAPPPPRGSKPGESLAPAAVSLLRDLGQGDLLDRPVHRRSETTFSSWGTDALIERNAIALPGGLGSVIDRARFEADLREAALRAGTDAVPASLGRFARRDGLWRLETDAGEATEAAFLVDATGRSAAIGRRLSRARRHDRLVAAHGFLDPVEDDVDPTPATVIEATEDGWWYATLLADRRLAISYYSDPDLLPRGLSRDRGRWRDLIGRTRYIARWIDSGGFAVVEAPRLASVGTTWLERAAGPGWIAVGDASAALDPLSAHGMTTALWAGLEAAAAIDSALKGDDAALDAYAARVIRGVSRFRAERQAIYARETRFAPRTFWRRRIAVR